MFGTVMDDRGRPADRRIMSLSQGFAPDIAARMRLADPWARVRLLPWIMGFFLIHISLWLLAFRVLRPGQLGGPVLGLALFFGTMLIGFALWIIPIGWLVMRRPEERQRKRAGLCAACCADLAGLPAHTDGCTVCPKCGAAWRMPTQSTP
jgi:hypothetical protein